MVTRSSQQEILRWHQNQGGFPGSPAAHALRLLRECVELCVASGASQTDLTEAMNAEIAKASRKGEFRPGKADLNAVLEEMADVTILTTVFQGYFLDEPSVDWAVDKKFEICRMRHWEADAAGVLWRPGHSGAPTAIPAADTSESS